MATQSLALLTKAKDYLLSDSNQKQELSTASLYDYSNITLRLYIEIATTSEYSKLIISGLIDHDQLKDHWEKIVSASGKATGNMSFDAHLNNLKRYANLLADYNLINAALANLVILYNEEDWLYLKQRRYNVSLASQDAYVDSLRSALTKATNITTKIASAYNELLAQPGDENSPTSTIGELIASLNVVLGAKYLDVNCLLSEYNEYKKIAKLKTPHG